MHGRRGPNQFQRFETRRLRVSSELLAWRRRDGFSDPTARRAGSLFQPESGRLRDGAEAARDKDKALSRSWRTARSTRKTDQLRAPLGVETGPSAPPRPLGAKSNRGLRMSDPARGRPDEKATIISSGILVRPRVACSAASSLREGCLVLYPPHSTAALVPCSCRREGLRGRRRGAGSSSRWCGRCGTCIWKRAFIGRVLLEEPGSSRGPRAASESGPRSWTGDNRVRFAGWLACWPAGRSASSRRRRLRDRVLRAGVESESPGRRGGHVRRGARRGPWHARCWRGRRPDSKMAAGSRRGPASAAAALPEARPGADGVVMGVMRWWMR